ncbi:MAG: autotransporter-associated beta strand repeat-containing protein, partial [Pirellulaceae bacterium]|nr:autotransporter-associated beta strand repeat-containing protein [Pirellulaceae bacterium]
MKSVLFQNTAGSGFTLIGGTLSVAAITQTGNGENRIDTQIVGVNATVEVSGGALILGNLNNSFDADSSITVSNNAWLTAISSGSLSALGSAAIEIDGAQLVLALPDGPFVDTLNKWRGRYWDQDPSALPGGRGGGCGLGDGLCALDSYATLIGVIDQHLPAANYDLDLIVDIDFPAGGVSNSTNDNPHNIAVDGTTTPNTGNDNIVDVWQGFLDVKAADAGSYTFFTASDDGSVVYVDGIRIVNNNQFQGVTERSGTIDLTEGVHEIIVVWYEGGGDGGVTAHWQGPATGGNKLLINPTFTSSAGSFFFRRDLLPGIDPNLTLNNAISVSNSATIELDEAVNRLSLSSLLADDSPNLTLAGLGAGQRVDIGDTTLADSANRFVLNNVTAFLNNVTEIATPANLLKAGTGLLVLPTANTYTGDTVIEAGIVRLGNNAALGDETGKTVIQAGATLDIAGFRAGANGNEQVEVVGAGVGGAGAIINTGGTQASAFRRITLTGDATFSARARWDMRDTGGASSFDMGGHTLSKIGASEFVLLNTTVQNPGSVNVNQGLFRIEGSTDFDGTGTIAVANGTTLDFYASNSTHAVNINLAGGANVTTNGSGGPTVSGAVTLSGIANLGLNYNLTLSGRVTGAGGFNKNNGATLTLANGSNDYAGITTVNAGRLRVTADGALGTTAAGTVVNNGATLEFDGAFQFSVPEPITATGYGTGGVGALSSVGGNRTLPASYPLTLNTPATIGSHTPGNRFSIERDLDLGISGLTVTGAGDTVLAGVLSDDLVGRYRPGLLAGSHSGNPWTSGVNPGNLGFSLGPQGMLRDGGTRDAEREAHWTAARANGGTGPGDTTLIYSGQIYLAGDTTFVEQNDDSTILSVGGTQIISDSVWNNAVSATYAASPGWYDFEVRFSNGSGGYGFSGQQNTGAGDSNWDLAQFGFGMAHPPVSGENAQLYAYPEDPGDATRFRYPIDVASLTKSGSGSLFLSGDNTFGGDTNVLAGTVVVEHDNALGATAGTTTVARDATLALQGTSLSIAENLTVDGRGVLGRVGAISNLSGNNTLTGTVTAAVVSSGEVRIGSETAGDSLTMLGDIDLQYSRLSIDGPGDVVLGGSISGVGVETPLAASGSFTFNNGATGAWSVTSGIVGTYETGIVAAYMNGQTTWSDNQHPTLLFSSPGFRLDGSDNAVTFRLWGGDGNGSQGGLATLPTHVEQVLAIPTSLHNSSSGAQGVGLRRVDTGEYVLTAQRSGNGTAWENGSFSAAALQALHSADPDSLYTFDFYDYYSGGWGWVTLDDVSIPFDLTLVPDNRLIKRGTGTVTVSGDNSYNGETVIESGMLVAGSDTALGATIAGTVVADGATLKLSGAVSVRSETLTTRIVRYTGRDAVLSNEGVSTFDGAITLEGTSLTIRSEKAGDLLNLPSDIEMGGASLRFDGAGDVDATGVISGPLHLAGLMAGLHDGNPFLGPSSQNLGVVLAPLGGGPVATLNEHWSRPKLPSGSGPDNSTIVYTGQIYLEAGPTTFIENIDDRTSLVIDGVSVLNDGGWNVPAHATFTAPADGWYDFELRFANGGGGYGTVLNQGGWNSADFPAGVVPFGFGIDPEGRGTQEESNFFFPVEPGDQSLFRTSRMNSLVKTGTGTLTLSGNNSYAAPTKIDSGTLVAASDSALGSTDGATTVADGATLALSGGVSLPPNEALTVIGIGAAGRDGAIQNLDGNNVILGDVAVGSEGFGEIRIASSTGLLTIEGDIDLRRSTLSTDGDGDIVVDGVIASSRPLLDDSGWNGYFYDLVFYDGAGGAPGVGPFLLEPVKNHPLVLEASAIGATVITPRVDFGAGTETTAGDGSVLDRGGTNGNLFGGIGVNVGNDNVAAIWSGKILIAEAATYRFTTRSDDGTRLWIDFNNDGDFSDAFELVVENNRDQGMTNRSGSVRLDAGLYAIKIAGREGGGGAGMQASWEQLDGANSFGRRIIEPAVLYNDVATAGEFVAGGLRGDYYGEIASNFNLLTPNGSTASVTYLQNLAPTVIRTVDRVDFGSGTESSPGDGTVLDRGDTGGNPFGGIGVSVGNDRHGTVFVGYLNVETGGVYTFTERSDDGGLIFVNGVQVAGQNAGGGMTNFTGTIHLTPDVYEIVVVQWENTGGAGVQVSYSGPDTGNNRVNIPPSVVAPGIRSADNSLTKMGSGTLTLNAANPYGGGTTVVGGTLLVNNSSGSGTGPDAVTVGSAATLGGNGTVAGDVTILGDGTLSPGASPAKQSYGSLTLMSGSDFDVELFGTDPGNGASGYDQAIVLPGPGPVDVSDARLQLFFDATWHVPSPGDEYTIIDNQTDTAIVGTFADLMNNATFEQGGFRFSIDYEGGDGNDVMLTATAPTTVYVSPTFTTADAAVDGDLEADGIQPAAVGYNAFATIQAALDALDDSTASTVVINQGDYAETIVLPAREVALFLVAGSSSIASLTGGVDDTLALGGFDADHTLAHILTLSSGDIAGVISGSGGLIKLGSDVLTLSGENTYAGTTTVSAGTLIVGSDAALGTAAGGTIVESGGVLDLNGRSIGAESLTLSGTGIGGTGALINSSASPASHSGTVHSGTYSVGGTGDITLTGIVQGTLTKVGGNSLTFGGTADNAGLGVTATDGTVELAKISSADVHAIGGGGLTVNGAIVLVSGSGGDQILDGVGIAVNGGMVDLNGTSETIRYVSGSGGTVTNTGATLSILTLNLLNSGTQTYGGTVAGNLRIAVTSSTSKNTDVQTLTGNNSHTGGTLVDNGHLRIAADSGLGAIPGTADAANITLQNGGVLQNNNSDPILNVNRGITLGSGGGVIYAGWSKSVTILGPITGTGNLTKTDGGSLYLDGDNNYSGSTTVLQGYLVARHENALGDALQGTTVNSGATLQLAYQASDVVVAEPLTLSGSGVSGTAGALRNVSGANNLTGVITLAADTLLVIQGGSLNITGEIGEAGGSRALTKQGIGPLTLAAANTYSGATTVKEGDLIAGVASPIGAPGAFGDSTSAVLVGESAAFPLLSMVPTSAGTLTASLSFDDSTLDARNGPAGTDYFLGMWEGEIHIEPTDPLTWSFGTRSDDGSCFWIDLDQDGVFSTTGRWGNERIVNSNFLQGSTSRTGNATFPGPGSYRIAIPYFENSGGAFMEARFASGPDVAYDIQTVINPADAGQSGRWSNGATANQLGEKWYNTAPATWMLEYVAPLHSFPLLGMTPSTTGSLSTALDFGDAALDGRNGPAGADNFLGLWQGQIRIGQAEIGAWSFGTNSDDGSMLWIDLDRDGVFSTTGARGNELIVNNNGDHGQQVREGTATFPAAGEYGVAIAFYEKTGGALIQVKFAPGAGIPFASQAFVDPGNAAQAGRWSDGVTLNQLAEKWYNTTPADTMLAPTMRNAAVWTTGSDLGRDIIVAGTNGGTATLGGLHTAGTAEFTGKVTLNKTTTLSAAAGGTLSFHTGSISGDGSLVKTSEGTVVLGGDNSYSGETMLNAGTLVVAHDNGLGQTTAGTRVALGTTLAFHSDAGVDVPAEPIAIGGGGGAGGVATLRNLSGSNSLAGEITVDADSALARIAVESLDGELSLDGAVTLRGAMLDLSGAGNVTVSGQISNACPASLRALYRLEEPTGSTTARDSSANAFHGTFAGGAASHLGAAGYIAGQTQTLDFDGSDDHIVLTNANTLGLGGNFTVSAWVRPDALNGDRTILGTDQAGTNVGLHLIIRDSRFHFGFYSNDTGGTQTLTAGTWYHVVFRFQDGQQAIFVNGVQDAAGGGHAAFAGTGVVNIGRWNNGNYFDGLMDEVAVFDRALSNAEIQNLYASRPSAATVTLNGTGIVTLLGDNSYAGGSVVNSGTLLVNNTSGSGTGSGDLTVRGSATLGGNGHVAGQVRVQPSGTLAPGNSPDAFSVAGLTLDPGSDFDVEIVGDSLGDGDAGYDQVIVTDGPVEIGGASLNLFFDPGLYVPATGHTYTIIDNLSAGTVVGEFAGLPNNTVFERSGYRFRINYNVGTGNNDVVLTTLAPTTVYVNDDWTTPGTTVDGDLETVANEPATVGYNAFATWTAAVAALDPAAAGTLVVNAGTYNETVSLPAAQAVAVQLVQGDSAITGLSGDVNESLALGGFDANHTQSHTLTLGEGIIAGTISGTGGLTKVATGTLTLSGANNYTGATTISDGLLEVTGQIGAGGLAGTVSISSGATLSGNGTVNAPISGSAGSAIQATGDGFTLGISTSTSGFSTDGSLVVGSFAVTLLDSNVATLGPSTTLAGGTLTAANGISLSAGDNLTGYGHVNAAIAGNTGDITADTAGQTLVLGNGSASGLSGSNLTVVAGASATIQDSNGSALNNTLVDGTLNAPNGISIASGRTLTGSGTINGNVSGAGTFSPGTSPGVMTINGDFAPTGTVNFEVNSEWTTVGTHFDQYVVSGAVDLSGASVTFTNNADASPPAANSLIKLIDKTNGGATVASSNPAQGTTVMISSRSFKLFYNGGDGNDVVLVENTAPTTVYVDDAWTGLSTGQAIADADPVAGGAQPAIYGVTAFSGVSAGYTFVEAMNTVAAGGTVIVNAGDYSSQAVNVDKQVTLNLQEGPISFGSLDDSVTNATLNLNGIMLTIGTNNTSTQFDSAIGGTGSLTKTGAGTLILTGVNSYAGSTTVAEGIFEVTGSGRIQSTSTIAVATDATFRYAPSAAHTFNRTISGDGTLRLQYGGGDSYLVQSNLGNFHGQVIVESGSGWIRPSGSFSSQTARFHLNGGARVNLNGNLVWGQFSGDAGALLGSSGGGARTLTFGHLNTDATYAGTVNSVPISFVKVGSGTQIFTQNLNRTSGSGTGTTTIQAGAIQVGNGGTSGDLGGGVINNGASLIFNRSNDSTVGNTIAGNGTMTKTGAGTLTLTGDNSYSGGTTIAGGSVQANHNSALGTGSVTLASGAKRLMLGSGVSLNNDIAIQSGVNPDAGWGAISAITGGVLSGSITIDAPTDSGGHFRGGDGTNRLDITGPITSAATRVVFRSGNIRLSGGGDYPAADFGNGTLSLGADNGLNSSAELALWRSWGVTTFDLNGFDQTIAGLTQIGHGSDPATVTNTAVALSTFVIDNSDDCTYTGLISGNLNLLKTGSGTFTVYGQNDYTGSTTITDGTLELGLYDIGSPVGFWEMSEGSGATLGNSVAGSPGGTLHNSPSWVEGPGGEGTYGVSFNGSNQYALISPDDTLKSIGSGAFAVSSWVKTTTTGGWYHSIVSNFGTSSINNFWGLGWMDSSQLGLVVRDNRSPRNEVKVRVPSGQGLNGEWHHLAGVRDGQGSLLVYLDGELVATANDTVGDASNGRDILLARHWNTYVNESIAGVGIWNTGLDADSVWAIYRKGLGIDGGSLPATTALRLGVDGTFDTSGLDQTVGSLADDVIGGGQVRLGSGTLTTGGDGSSTSFSGVISGDGSLIKNGAGTMTLEGASIYTGNTTVSGGVLLVNGSIASNTTVSGSAVLGGTGTIAGNVTSSGSGTVNPGNSPGTLTITGNYSASTTFEVNSPYQNAGLGGDYDQVVVNGAANTIDLSAATITFVSSGDGTVPALPNLITLIQNNTNNPIAPFSNLAQGATVTLGSGGDARTFLASYTGGDGNDLVLFDAAQPATIYINDDFSGGDGQFILDADQGLSGDQSALFGVNAFTSIGAAQAKYPSFGGTFIVNGGSYTATTLDNTQSITVTGVNAAQTAVFEALTTAAGQNITIQGSSNLTTGDGNNTTIGGTISGGGSLTKQGAGIVTLSGSNSYTGLTTIIAGTIRLGSDSALGSTAAGTAISSDGTLDIDGRNILGEAITVAGTITNTGANQSNALRNVTLSGNAIFTGSGRWDIRGGSGLLATNGYTITKSGSNYVGMVDSQITGGGTINVMQGTLGLTRSQFLTGTVNLNAGTLRFENNSAGTFNYGMEINFSGGTLNAVGAAARLSGTLTLSGSGSRNIDTATGSGLVIDGIVAGSTGFTKNGGGVLTLTRSNTLSGTSNLVAGTVEIGDDQAFGTGLLDLRGSAIRSTNSDTRSIPNAVSLSDNTTFGSASTGNLVFTGDVNKGGGSKTMNVQNAATTFTGSVYGSGTGLIVKTGPGTLTLAGNNTYPGNTTINEGTLLVNGSTAAGSAFTVNNDAVLGGTGAIGGSVTLAAGSSSTLSPGSPVSSTADLATGSLTLHSGTTLAMQINGLTPDTQYDQVRVTGSVNLGSATLDTTSSTISGTSLGDKVVLIENDGGDAVTGQFA